MALPSDGGSPWSIPINRDLSLVLKESLGHPALMRAAMDEKGIVTLSGTVFSHEIERLLERLRRIDGVTSIRNHLHVVQSSALAAPTPSAETMAYESQFIQGGWPVGFRWAAGALSVVAILQGIRRKGPGSTLVSAVGLATLSRAILNRDVTQLFGSLILPVIRIHRIVQVRAPIEDTYDFWRRFDNYPLFMSFIQNVQVADDGYLHWQALAPGGTPVSWESQVTALRPNQRIAWKSIPGSLIANAGTIEFESLNPNETSVHIELSYAPPLGAAGYIVARALGFDPGHHIDEDLEAMRLLLEQPGQPDEAASA